MATLELGSSITLGVTVSSALEDQKAHKTKVNYSTIKSHPGVEESGELHI